MTNLGFLVRNYRETCGGDESFTQASRSWRVVGKLLKSFQNYLRDTVKRSFSTVTPTAWLQNLRFSAEDGKSKETGTTNEKPSLSTIENDKFFWGDNCLLMMKLWSQGHTKVSPVSISSIDQRRFVQSSTDRVERAILSSRKYTANRYRLKINPSLNKQKPERTKPSESLTYTMNYKIIKFQIADNPHKRLMTIK